MKLSEVKIGKLFTVGGIEFIKFSEDGDKTVVVAKDCVFSSQFGTNNNFAQSSILKRLNDEICKLVKSPDDDTGKNHNYNSNDNVVEGLLAGGPYDFLELALHLAEPACGTLGGACEDVFLVLLCLFGLRSIDLFSH